MTTRKPWILSLRESGLFGILLFILGIKTLSIHEYSVDINVFVLFTWCVFGFYHTIDYIFYGDERVYDNKSNKRVNIPLDQFIKNRLKELECEEQNKLPTILNNKFQTSTINGQVFKNGPIASSADISKNTGKTTCYHTESYIL